VALAVLVQPASSNFKHPPAGQLAGFFLLLAGAFYMPIGIKAHSAKMLSSKALF
jgi:hypothetical protein